MHPRRLLPLLLLAALLTACRGTRMLQDPTLEISTRGGRELGVSTDYGLVFLGHTARAGEVQVTAWFGDGPSIENSVIEPLGDGLYTAAMTIRLPLVQIAFKTPAPGARVLLMGRRGSEVTTSEATVRTDARIDGILLSRPGEFDDKPEQVGAGVYTVDDFSGTKRLVGLVSGKVRLVDEGGAEREYLTVAGPEVLWRIVGRDVERGRKRRWIYRPDIL